VCVCVYVCVVGQQNPCTGINLQTLNL